MGRLPAEIRITDRLRIPAGEIDLSYARSGGPGGQHVNKTSSKVLLRWNLARSAAPSDAERARLEERLGPRLTEDGDLLLTSERHREQSRNVEDVLTRFAEVLRKGLERPKPRKKTRPSRRQKQRRLDDKRRRGDIKRQRRPGSGE